MDHFLVVTGLTLLLMHANQAQLVTDAYSTTPAIPPNPVISGNLSRSRPTFQSATYDGRVASRAVDGNYDNTKPDSCSTTLNSYSSSLIYIGTAPISAPSYVWWMVDLGNTYAVLHVILYNAGFLPDTTFFRDMYIQVYNGTYNNVQCGTTYGLETTEQRIWNVSCKPFAYGQQVVIYRRSSSDYLTLCEVDVIGAKLNFLPQGDLSTGKPVLQASTYNGRIADKANDGIVDTTNSENCATSVAYHAYNYVYNPNINMYSSSNVVAWWQVDLQEWSVVTSVVIYVPSSLPDSMYAYFYIYIGRTSNLTDPGGLASCASYPSGNCVFNNGTMTINCTCQSQSTPYYGRYVTIRQRTSPFMAVLTLCEVIVYGRKLQLQSTDFSLVYVPVTDNTNNTTYNDTSGAQTTRAIAIAALIIACIALVGIVVLIVLGVKILLNLNDKGMIKREEDRKPKPVGNQYSDTRNVAYDNAAGVSHSAGDDELYVDASSPNNATEEDLYDLPSTAPPSKAKHGISNRKK